MQEIDRSAMLSSALIASTIDSANIKVFYEGENPIRLVIKQYHQKLNHL